MGRTVLPEFQGRGIAGQAAAAATAHAAGTGRPRWLHAFPAVDDPASNAVYRRVGFVLAVKSVLLSAGVGLGEPEESVPVPPMLPPKGEPVDDRGAEPGR